MRNRQTGITALGFLFLATLVGIVTLAAIKVTPMYIKNMRLSTIMDDVERDLGGQGSTPATIRRDLESRFSVEDINLSNDEIKIAQSKNGYSLHIQYESRAPFIADVWLLVAFDKQVEIRR
jgi:hypothetical protein